MIKLSITMIIKNEELTLKRVLSCLKFADEIIIVDTGSNDNSINIAKEFTNNIFNYKWDNDFAKARNYAISKATQDYFMWLDADDIITEEDQNKILKLKDEIIDEDIILLPYVVQEMSFYRERIIKRKDNFFVGKVHEAIPLKGKLKYVNIPIYHSKIKVNEKERNLKIYQEILSKRKLKGRELYYYANELKDNNYLDEAEKNFLSFLNEDNVLKENKSDACLKLSQIYHTLKNETLSDEFMIRSLKYGINSSLQIINIIMYYYEKKDYFSCELFSYLLLFYHDNPLAFSYTKHKDYYAYLYLALCSYYKGNKKAALIYNKKALEIKKNDEIALKNQEYYLR